MIKKKRLISILSAFLIISSGIVFATLSTTNTSGDDVALPKWTVSNEKSMVKYETTEHADTDGLSVRLAQGDSLEFSQIIDLSAATKNDTLIDFYVLPDNIGSADFEKLYFKFTDVENPECYLTVAVRASMASSTTSNAPWTYFYAGGNGQKLRSQTVWNGTVFNEDYYGLGVVHSFKGYYGNTSDAYVTRGLNRDYGLTNVASLGFDLNEYGLTSLTPNGESKLDQVSISLRYDVSENSVYANGLDRRFWDMDDVTLNEVVWNGFESGKVRLSVSADLYKGATANFVIKDIYGLDLTTPEFFDKKTPMVTVNLPTDGELETYVGYPYTIPSVSIYDEYDDNCKLSTKVWYRYDSATPYAVEIVDGKFTAEKGGYYTIVYTARDLSGNTTEKEVWIYAKDEKELKLNFVGEYATVGVAGEKIRIAEYSIDRNVSGEATTTIKALLNGEETKITDGIFEPQKSGVYTIEYTATDYLGRTVVASYRLEVQNATEMQLKDAYAFPQALVAGIEYTLPSYYAYDYTGGSLVKREMSLYVTDKNGEYKAENNTFKAEVSANGETINLAFKVEGSALTLEKDVPTAMAYVEGKLEMENYFLTKNTQVVASGKGIAVTAQARDSSWLFANKLLAYDFDLSLRANVEKSTFSALVITLTDSENSDISQTVKLGYTKDGDTKLIIGDDERVLDYGFKNYNDENKNEIKLRMLNGRFSVGDVSLKAENFDGFPSGFVYLTVAFEGAETGSEYSVTMINGQAVTSSSNDRIRPRIDLQGSYSVCVDKDSKVNIPKAIAGDVLHDVKSITVSVTDGNGAIVTSVDGVRLENVAANRIYEIVVSSYGQYVVTYAACDTANELESTRSFAVTAEDNTAPQIEASDIVDKATLGDTILVAGIEYSDNVSVKENLKVYITVYTPDGGIIELNGKSNSFIPAQVGIYQVRICVYDENGNMGYWTKNIAVKEASK